MENVQKVFNDFRPLIQKLVDEIKDSDYGTLFTFEKLSEIIGRDIQQCRNVIYGAKNRLMKHHDRLLIAVKGIGVRILEQKYVADNCGKDRKSAYKKLKKSNLKMKTVDLSSLTDIEKYEFVKEQMKTCTLMTMHKHADKKLIETNKKGDPEINLPTKDEILSLIFRK